MEPLTFFTAKLYYPAVVAAEASDLDTDPQVEGVSAGVTITAFVTQPLPREDDVHADEIPAADLSPTAAMIVQGSSVANSSTVRGPASVRMRWGVRSPPLRPAIAWAKQRMPLPLISARLPSAR